MAKTSLQQTKLYTKTVSSVFLNSKNSQTHWNLWGSRAERSYQMFVKNVEQPERTAFFIANTGLHQSTEWWILCTEKHSVLQTNFACNWNTVCELRWSFIALSIDQASGCRSVAAALRSQRAIAVAWMSWLVTLYTTLTLEDGRQCVKRIRSHQDVW